jgi:hypothetical protein
MTVSKYTLIHLARAVCGDSRYTPYLTGAAIVHFFNKYGYNEAYGEGFPSRWKYTEDRLRELNGKDSIEQIIEEIVEPGRYLNTSIQVNDAETNLNEFLRFDKYELRKIGDSFKLVTVNSAVVQPNTSKEINHDFINEQIKKCHNKIFEGDYYGAIANARLLIETIFIEIIERSEGQEVKNDGDAENLWKRVKKILKLKIKKAILPDYVFQMLSGINASIKGLAGLSNNAADRHDNKFKTRRQYTKLAINLAMTLADFLLDSWQYQIDKKR